jgi:hypothetical protein
VPSLRVFGAAALAKPPCHSLAQKARHAAAKSAAVEDRIVDYGSSGLFDGSHSAAQASGVGGDLGQRFQRLGHPQAVTPLGVECVLANSTDMSSDISVLCAIVLGVIYHPASPSGDVFHGLKWVTGYRWI